MTGRAVREAECLARGADGVLTRAQARRSGVSDQILRRLLNQGAWAAVHPGIYLVDADALDEVPMAAARRAALLAFGADAGLGLATAGQVHGLPVAADTVHVYLPPERRRGQPRERRLQAPGLLLHWRALAPEEFCSVAGLRVTSLLRTVGDLACSMDLGEATCLLDEVLHGGRLTAGDLELLGPRLRGHRGARTWQRAVGLADARSESPLETRIRLACVTAGVPPDVLQHPVRDRHGMLLGRADLAWVRRRTLVVECDGAAYHSHLQALLHDRRRQNDLVSAECEVLRFTWQDSLHPAYVGSAVRAALARVS